MIVMPSISETQQCHPPIVGGSIAGFKAARSPNVGDRVDEPRGMESRDRAKKCSPQQEGKSTDCEQHEPDDNHWREMVLREPDVNLVLGQVGDVAFECWYVL